MLFDYFIFALSIPNAIEILVATSFTEFGYNPNCVIGFLSGIQLAIQILGPFKYYYEHKDYIYEKGRIHLSIKTLFFYGLFQLINFCLILRYFKEIKKSQETNEKQLEQFTNLSDCSDVGINMSNMSNRSQITDSTYKKMKIDQQKLSVIKQLKTQELVRKITSQSSIKQHQMSMTFEDDENDFSLNKQTDDESELKKTQRKSYDPKNAIVKKLRFSEYGALLKAPFIKTYIFLNCVIVILKLFYTITLIMFINTTYNIQICMPNNCKCLDSPILITLENTRENWLQWIFIAVICFGIQSVFFPILISKTDKFSFMKNMSYIQFSTFIVFVIIFFIRTRISCQIRSILEDSMIIIRLTSLTSIQLSLFLIINKEIPIRKRGRIYAIIIAFTNLQQPLFPLLFFFISSLEPTGDRYQDDGNDFFGTCLTLFSICSFLLIGQVHLFHHKQQYRNT